MTIVLPRLDEVFLTSGDLGAIQRLIAGSEEGHAYVRRSEYGLLAVRTRGAETSRLQWRVALLDDKQNVVHAKDV